MSIAPSPSVSLSKTNSTIATDGGAVDSGDTVTYTYVVTNTGRNQFHDRGTPTVSSGGTVKVEVVVTNTGNVTLNSITATDSSSDTPALNNLNFTLGTTSLAPGKSTLSNIVTLTSVTASGTDTASVSGTGAGQTKTDSDPGAFLAPPIVITGSPQFNFPNDITKIQPKVGGGASFTFNPGGYIYWDLFTPDQASAQIDTRAGSFSGSYANLTISIVQIWSANGTSGKGATGAAIYRIYAADNTANTQVALANNTNIVGYSIVDNTGAAASSTNKGLIDLVNSDPLIGNFNNFANIENALTKPPNNDGFSFPTTTTGNQTQVWLSSNATGTASGETPRTFTDSASTNVALYGTNNTGAGDTLSVANSASNLIDGRGGNDSVSVSVTGTGGNYLDGGGFGNETITGGSGPDTLLGGYGANTMTGGGGGDVFILQRGEIDTITDFVSGDQLWIDTFVGSNGATGSNGMGTAAGGAGDSTGTVHTPVAGADFISGANVTPSVPASGSVVFYNTTSGDLWFATAGEKLALADTPLAVLQGHPAVAPGDIRYDPTVGSLNQLMQAVAGTPLGGNSGAVATNPLANATDTLWNHHELAASTG